MWEKDACADRDGRVLFGGVAGRNNLGRISRYIKQDFFIVHYMREQFCNDKRTWQHLSDTAISLKIILPFENICNYVYTYVFTQCVTVKA